MEDVSWFPAEQIEDWKALMALTLALPAALDAQLKRDGGMTSFEYHVMAALSDSPGRSLPMSVLSSLASASMSRVSHVVARLELAGWVERRASQLTGCRTEAHLTDLGWGKVQETAPAYVQEAHRLVLDVLSPDELRVLGEAVRKIIQVADPRMTPRLAKASVTVRRAGTEPEARTTTKALCDE